MKMIENHIMDDVEDALEQAQTDLSAINELHKSRVIDLPPITAQSIEVTLEKVTKALWRAKNY